MKLHEKLAALRKRAGLSQMELAERMETTRQAVSKWETGTALPSTENLRSLCWHYHVTMDFMVDEGRDLTELDSAPMQEPARPQAKDKVPKQAETEEEKPKKKQMWVLVAVIVVALAVGIGVIMGQKEKAIPLEEFPVESLDPDSEIILPFTW